MYFLEVDWAVFAGTDLYYSLLITTTAFRLQQLPQMYWQVSYWGLIAGWAMRHTDNQGILLLGAVGFCGGFSTFSTFSLENVQLWQNGNLGAMFLNILLSVVLCFGSVWLGLRIMGS